MDREIDNDRSAALFAEDQWQDNNNSNVTFV